MKVNPSTRLTFIDVARSYAIILALLAHTFSAIGLFEKLGSDSLFIKQFTRTATPMFVFMFGFMVEFIYINRTRNYGISSVRRRLFIRSFQCYIAYALTSFCAFLGDYQSIKEFISSLVFLSNSRFGNILRAYSVMLLLTPIIINLRLRFGVKLLYGLLITLFASYAYIHELQSIDFGILNHPLNILLGIGSHRGGPSVFGAFSFYLSGMIIASSFTKISPDNKPAHFYGTIISLAFIVIILGSLLINEEISTAWMYFSDFTYRRLNAPGYYIIGILCSLLTIAIFYFFVGSKKPSKPVAFILPIGTSSLISYTAGNIILNLLGVRAEVMNQFVFTITFFASVVFITRYIYKIPYYENIRAFMNLEYYRVAGDVSPPASTPPGTRVRTKRFPKNIGP